MSYIEELMIMLFQQLLSKHDETPHYAHTATARKLDASVNCEGLPTSLEQKRCLEEGGIMLHADSHLEAKAQFCGLIANSKDCYTHGGWVASTSAKNDKKVNAEVDCEGLPTPKEQKRCLEAGGIMIYPDSHLEVKSQFCELASNPEDCYTHGSWVASAGKKKNNGMEINEEYCDKLGTPHEISRCVEEGGYMVYSDSHPKIKVTFCELLGNKEDMDSCYSQGGWFAARSST